MSGRLDGRARTLLTLRELASKADLAAKEAKRERDDFEGAFWTELEDLGLKSFTMSDGTRLDRKETLYHEVIDVQELLAWAEENGMDEEWFGKAERKAALNEFVRTAVENNVPLPPGLGPRAKRYISITLGKG